MGFPQKQYLNVPSCTHMAFQADPKERIQLRHACCDSRVSGLGRELSVISFLFSVTTEYRWEWRHGVGVYSWLYIHEGPQV